MKKFIHCDHIVIREKRNFAFQHDLDYPKSYIEKVTFAKKLHRVIRNSNRNSRDRDGNSIGHAIGKNWTKESSRNDGEKDIRRKRF